MVMVVRLAFLVAASSACPQVVAWSTLHTYRSPKTQIYSTDSNIDVSSLLYKEQEKLLVERGAFEGELMGHFTQGIQANIVKGVGGGGGFGGSKTPKKNSLKEQGRAHAKVLREEGVVSVDHVLSDAQADAVRDYVMELRQDSQAKVDSKQIKSLDRFADVLLKTNRCDLTLPLGPKVVADALVELLLQSPVAETLRTLLGKDAILYELSCLISDPSSQRQVVHPDTPYAADDLPVLFTCFIALQDIQLDMGPTTWLPRTHTKEAHERFGNDTPGPNGGESEKDKLLRRGPAVLGLLKKGSCGIFDSRLLHCGGANISNTSRAIMYFSFRNPKVPNAGNPGSIRPNLIGKWTLAKLETELKLYCRGKSAVFRQDNGFD
jgi:ectoine hydroxylase-related dioxygenase (phytanoyl-CoA dioxygenase family)